MFHSFRHRRALSSRLWWIVILTLFWTIADTSLEFLFPTYLEGLGHSYFIIGLLISIPAIIGMLIDMPLGSLSDSWSRKRIMIWGLILSPIGGALIFLFKGNALIFTAFILWGIGYQVWHVPRSAYFAQLTSRKKRAEQYGVATEFSYLGETVGPVIGGVLLSSLGLFYNVSFYVALCFLLAFLVFFLIKEKQRKRKESVIKTVIKSRASFSEDISILKKSGFYAFVLLYISLLFTFFWGAIYTLEPLFYGSGSLKLSPAIGGLILASFSLPAIFLGAPFGKLADRYGKKNLLFIGMLIMGLGLVFFSVSASPAFLIIFALLTSVGLILSQPALSGMIVDLSYRHSKGALCGIWEFFSDFGFILGPLLAGLFAELWGLQEALLSIGWIIVISAVILLIARKKPHAYL